jgi:hypothetical protein
MKRDSLRVANSGHHHVDVTKMGQALLSTRTGCRERAAAMMLDEAGVLDSPVNSAGSVYKNDGNAALSTGLISAKSASPIASAFSDSHDDCRRFPQ